MTEDEIIKVVCDANDKIEVFARHISKNCFPERSRIRILGLSRITNNVAIYFYNPNDRNDISDLDFDLRRVLFDQFYANEYIIKYNNHIKNRNK